jgi:futalosine hydrolase
MKILIVAATRAELSGIYTRFELPESDFVQTGQFDILITGVGMTATAFALGRHLHTPYALVVNLGIAGCYDWKFPLGRVLSISEDTFSELGAEDKNEFLSIDSLGFGKSLYKANHQLTTPHFINLAQVSGITVNKVHGNKTSIKAIEQRLHPVTESMEGAAVFYCCEQNSIPCIQVRSISNYVEERHRESWKIGLAINNLNDWAIEFLTHV